MKTSLADICTAGDCTAMIRNQTPLDTVDIELLKRAPSLVAFADENRGKMLGEVV